MHKLLSVATGTIGDLACAGADLVAPRRCAGCGRSGEQLCRRCAAALAWLDPGVRGCGPGQAVQVRPEPATPHFPPTWSTVAYADPVRAMVVGYKDRDRRDARGVLAALLAIALTTAARVARGCDPDTAVDPSDERAGQPEALGTRAARRAYVECHPTVVVPLPSSAAARRARGDHPVRDLVAEATRRSSGRWGPGPVVVADVLSLRRRVADQAGLTSGERAANLAGAYVVRSGWLPMLRVAHCVLVDDVVTTGATLGEGARALRAAGCPLVLAATVAAARRRHPSVPTLDE